MKNAMYFIGYLIVRFLGKLPFKVLYFMGCCLGHIYWFAGSRDKRITLKNIAVCLPHLDEAQRTNLSKKSMIHTMINVFETAWIWGNSPRNVEKMALEYENLELLKEYESSSKGTLLLCAHFGCWELLSGVLGTHCESPMYLGKLSGIELFDNYIKQGREKSNSKLANTSREGIEHFIEHIKHGELSAMMSDQEPSIKHGLFSDFFNQKALTSVLAQKIIQDTQPNVIVATVIRLPKAKGFKVVFEKPGIDIFSDDLDVSTRELNKIYENIILKAPEQYIWSYKKFKTRPEGTRSIY